MQPFSIPVLPPPIVPRIRPRTALLASADRSFRQRLHQTLAGLRWQVREAETGAQAWAEAQASTPEAVIVDSWLPDLELSEFLSEFRTSFPKVDLVTTAGPGLEDNPRSPYRQELLHALRTCQDNDTAIWNAPAALPSLPPDPFPARDSGMVSILPPARNDARPRSCDAVIPTEDKRCKPF